MNHFGTRLEVAQSLSTRLLRTQRGEKRECSPSQFSFQFPRDDEGHLTRECAGPSGPERAGQVSFPVQEDLRADRH